MSWINGLRAQSVRAWKQNSVVLGHVNLLYLLKEYFSSAYHMCQFIPLHSCDYLKEISRKLNKATVSGKSKIEHDTEQALKLE